MIEGIKGIKVTRVMEHLGLKGIKEIEDHLVGMVRYALLLHIYCKLYRKYIN